MARPRILVINSCGKAKSVVHHNQPTCKDLKTQDQRNAVINNFSKFLTPAKDLYIGPQARAVKQAIFLLQKLHDVDYYIISAGFGLVEANKPLPPYECSFSGLSKKEIIARSKELNIPQTLLSLLSSSHRYDFIFLTLGKDYLTALGDLDVLLPHANKVVIFTRLNRDSSDFEVYNPQIFVENKASKSIFSVPIGPTIGAKGTILLNYAKDLDNLRVTAVNYPFSQWWGDKERELEKQSILHRKQVRLLSMSSSIALGDNKDRYIYSKPYNREDDYMVSEGVLSLIKKKVESDFSDDEVKKLWESCITLRTIDSRSGETRRDYVDLFKEYHNFFKEIKTKVEAIVKEAKSKYPDESLKNIRSAIVQELRSRQKELGYEKTLLNEVKYATIKSIVTMLENPEKLDEPVVYKPRKSAKAEKKKIPRIAELNFDFEILKKYKTEDKWEVVAALRNKSNFPLQNVQIEILDEIRRHIPVVSASGHFVELAQGIIHIPFVPASMTDQVSETRIMFKTEIIEPLDEGFIAKVTVDFTFTKEKIEKLQEMKKFLGT